MKANFLSSSLSGLSPVLMATLFASIPLAANAGDLYWDATPGAADGASAGGTGTWDTATANWDNGAYNIWNNTNNDTAIFGGTSGAVTLGTNITVGGLTFNTNGYSIATGGGTVMTLGTNTDINVSTGTSTIFAEIEGSNNLTKSGTGTLLLNTAISSNFTGNTVITGGTLQIGNNSSAARLGGSTYAGNISLNGGSIAFINNDTQTLSGIISGSGNFTKSGGGTLTLTGANTYTGKTIIGVAGAGGRTLSVSSLNSVVGGTASSSLGAPTTVANGTIQLGSGSSVRSSNLVYTGSGETTDRIMNVQFNSSAKHSISSSAAGLLKFTSAFTITPSSGTTGGGLYLKGSGNGEIAQIGTLPGFLEKQEAGTWTVGGTNSFDRIAVSGGSLINNGSMNVTTSVAVNNGTTLSAGNITAQTMTLGATSIINMELGGTTLGTEYDNIDVTTALAYGGNLEVANISGYDMDLASATYNLFELNAVTATGTFASVTVNSITLSNSGGVWTGDNGAGVDYTFTQATGDLAITAVPEPSSILLLSLTGLALLRRRRR
jgi:fibronectin-binding autotransporter adhesin